MADLVFDGILRSGDVTVTARTKSGQAALARVYGPGTVSVRISGYAARGLFDRLSRDGSVAVSPE